MPTTCERLDQTCLLLIAPPLSVTDNDDEDNVKRQLHHGQSQRETLDNTECETDDDTSDDDACTAGSGPAT